MYCIPSGSSLFICFFVLSDKIKLYDHNTPFMKSLSISKLFFTVYLTFGCIFLHSQSFQNLKFNEQELQHKQNLALEVPDGNYTVKIKLGSAERNTLTTVRAESSRLFLNNIST